MKDIFPDKIFVRYHYTDFEKLLFALGYINKLKNLLDKAEQEISRLNNKLKKQQEEIKKKQESNFEEKEKLILKINALKELALEEQINIHYTKEIIQLRGIIKYLQEKNNKLATEIERINGLNNKQ